MHGLFVGLRRLYLDPACDWAEVARTCQNHPLWNLIHQDPLTCRSFAKPRGYAGDAELLDLIYRRCYPGVLEACTPLGRELYEYWDTEPGAQAVRQRRRVLGQKIDATLLRNPRSRILAVAAGHLRELDLCRTGVEKIDLLALDQDPLSLAEVERCYRQRGVSTLQAKASSLLRGLRPGSFDLVYAAGLYDYLTDGVCRKLTGALYGTLNPGGTLLFANFLPDVHAIGYMRTFMGWNLFHRTLEGTAALANGLSPAPASVRSYAEDQQNIAIVEVEKPQ